MANFIEKNRDKPKDKLEASFNEIGQKTVEFKDKTK